MEYIDIKKLNLDELVGVVNLYPWFSGARVELCERMSRMGGAWGVSQYADAAMYVGAREKLASMVRSSVAKNLNDSDVEQILKSYISKSDVVCEESVSVPEQRRVHVVGGDFFSQADYDKVRRNDDNVFSRYAAKAKEDKSYEEVQTEDFDIYTETLAQIYAEQGYYEQAKNIYSKLILAYPEKSAYFAALIQNLKELN